MEMQNLPSKSYEQLIGRDKWVDRILRLLRDPGKPPILSINGMGGVGKTALAYEVARRAIENGFFQDVLWESAKQYDLLGNVIAARSDPDTTIENMLIGLARQLGRFEMLQLDPDERRLRLQYILQHTPYLIVIDNLETVEESQALVGELSNLLKPSRAILTSRIQCDSKDVKDLHLEGFSQSIAITFLREVARSRGVEKIGGAKRDILKRITAVTGGIPLAMQFFVAQVEAGLSVDEELMHLESAENEEILYRYIYFDLWSTLKIPSQKILVAIPAFATTVPRFLLQPVARVSDEEFEPAVRDLIKKSLVHKLEQDDILRCRYSVHQLTRNFVNSDLRAVWEAQKAAKKEMQ
jgi:hypothetical protein